MRIQHNPIKHQSGELCPSCCSTDVIRNKGVLEIKSGKYGKFLSCSKFPDCRYSCKLDKNLENQATALLKRKNKRRGRNSKGKNWHKKVEQAMVKHNDEKKARRQLAEHYKRAEDLMSY